MAKPNYSFEKRQRELAKKKKKEGKLADRAARKTGGFGDEVPSEESGVPSMPGPSDPALGGAPGGAAAPEAPVPGAAPRQGAA